MSTTTTNGSFTPNGKQLEAVLRHINNVREDCEILGLRLIEQGEAELGRMLIANGLVHDNSKLSGIEWQCLHSEVKEKDERSFYLAFQQHISTNKHHPEHWPGGIEEMPRVYVAEMVCDWRTRAYEFGTDLREWCKGDACKKYKISHSGKIYKEIKEFMDMLLERRFK